ncbi:MAG: DUF262 domain-containing protein [Odoribacter sp.]|nr:DUF262 domain-containing protein [Odoribacter sp.]
MSALDALRFAENHTLLLPDIQREYVWDYQEIERLFESIVDEYPIGSCIFWKTNRATINAEKPNLYYFLREYERWKTKNEKAPEVFSNEIDYYIVLDGQQRITSLNIALYGSYTYYKGGRGHAWDNPKSWLTKELYYNLDFYAASNEEEDDENPRKRFVFLTKEDAEAGHYYKIKNLLAFDKLQRFVLALNNLTTDEKVIDDLSMLFERLHNASGNGLIHYYCISENTYDEALDIFVRVNSTGRKLSKSDLLFSTLIDGWKTGKENIENLLATMNSKGDKFNFTRDYLMRLCLVLVDANTNLKINSLNQKTVLSIRDNWDAIYAAADTMSTVLADIGLSNETLTSYNATMPIVYFLYKGGKIKDKEAKKEVRKFLSVAMAQRLFGVASNDALNKTRNVLKALDCKKAVFGLSLFAETTLTGGRTFTVSEKDIDHWLNTYEKGQSTYLLLALLYPNYKLSQVAFHQDHCHPHVSFDDKNIIALGLTEEKVKEWQKKRNLLPNLQFLEGTENESKNKTPLYEWVNAGYNFLYRPAGVSLELKDFDVFFNERRKLIKKELASIFGVTLPEENPDSNTEEA